MTGRLLTVTTALALSVSLAYADQGRQRWPTPSSGGGSGSSSGQSSGGSQSSGGARQSSGGGQSSAGSQSSGGIRSSVGRMTSGSQSSGGSQRSGASQRSGQSSGGSQVQRWGAPREAAPRQATPPPTPRPEASAPATASAATPRQESGGSVVRSYSWPRAESTPPPAPRSGGSLVDRARTAVDRADDQPSITPRATATPFFTQAGPRTATPRDPAAAPAPAPTSTTTAGDARRAAAPATTGQRVAQPRQRVPNPQDQQTYAVPRGTPNPPVVRPGSDDRFRVRSTTRVYNNYYYYYPRHDYPYGFGSYGLGYFYYDPYAWYDTYPVYSYPSYASGIYNYPYQYPTGELRLQVRPRHAEVYVDGYYAGRVDEFDGFFQSLRIEEGPHTIEIVARGYQTLVFNVRIIAGRKLDYKADLRPY